MKPRIIIHNGASLDGRMDWGGGDEGLYYQTAAAWNADAMLAGCTALANFEPDDPSLIEEGPFEPAELHPLAVPLLAVTDSRGRVRSWRAIQGMPYWRKIVVLASKATPAEYLEYLQKRRIETIVTGEERVDLPAAIDELSVRFSVKTIRVDSGGVLNGLLLRAGLVDEVSVLVNPCLVGGVSPSSIFRAPDLPSAAEVIPLRLAHMERLEGDVVWLRYEVSR